MGEQKDIGLEGSVVEEAYAYISVCTSCQGKGYVEISQIKNQAPEPEIKDTCFLPEIVQTKIIKKPHSCDEIVDSTPQGRSSFRSLPTVGLVRSKKNSQLPRLVKDKPDQNYSLIAENNKLMSHGSLRHSNNMYFEFENTLLESRNMKRPQEVVKSIVCRLNDTYWESRKSGVEDALQLSRFAPDVLEPLMPLLNKTLCDLLCSLRSQVTAFACRAAQELFCSMQSTARPEFDELVHCLLNRTADTNKFIRHSANEALDSMVTFIPPVHAVRALVDKGPYHKNPLVRTACARLLTCVVALKTPFAILTQNYLRETCKRILESAAILLNDHNIDARSAAKKLFQRFFKEKDFEEVYITEVNDKLRKSVEGSLFLLMNEKDEKQI